MSRLKNTIILFIYALFPIMSIINLFGKFPFNAALSDILVIILGLLCIIDIKNFRLKYNLRYLWYFMGLIIAIVISDIIAANNNSIVGLDVKGYISELIKFIIVAIYFFIGINSVKNNIQFKNIVKFWIVGIWITIVIGIVTQASFLMSHGVKWHNTLGQDERFLGGFTDPNLAGTYLTMSAFVVLIYMKMFKKVYNTLFGVVTISFIFICILMTQSRGTLVGFIFTFLIYLFLNIKKSYRIIIVTIPFAITVFFAFINIDYTLFESNISYGIENRINTAIKGQDQVIIRKTLSIASLMMGADHPITGVGRGNFRLNSKKYIDQIYTGDKSNTIYSIILESIPHNTFAGMFAETGIMGLTIFCLIFAILIFKLLKKRNPINTIILLALGVFLIESLVLNLENFRGFWLFIGLAFAIQMTDIYIVKQENVRLKFNKWIMVCLCITVITSCLLYIDAGRKVVNRVILCDTPYITYINDVKTGNSYELVYSLKSSGNANDLSRVKVYQLYEDGEKMYKEFEYWKVDGTGKIQLDASNGVKGYRIEWTGLNTNTYTSLKQMYYIVNGKKIPMIPYKYLPEWLERSFKKFYWLKLRSDYENLNIVDTNNNKNNVNKKLQIVNTQLKEFNGDIICTFKMKTSQKLDKDYLLQISAYIDDINNAPYRNGYFNNFADYYSITPQTSMWEVGKEYEFSVVYKSKKAKYQLYACIKDIPDTKVYLGQGTPDSFSIIDYLKNIKENQLIITSVLYDASKALGPDYYEQAKKFNFNLNLRGKYTWSYIGISGNLSGIKPVEILKNEKITLDYKKGDKLGKYQLPFDLHVESAGYTSGNTSSIVIDGVEYSKKQEGINIVLYDTEKNQVVDSENFKTYITLYK